MDTSALLAIAVAIAAFFWVVLPGLVLSAAVLASRRETRRPRVRLCRAADVSDPSTKPCWAPEGGDYCEQHR